MAVAVLGGTEVGFREIGHTVSIANDNRAKLMYYLDCMCSLLDMSDQPNLIRLRNFTAYNSLSEEEVDALSDELCGSDNNKFLEISALQRDMVVSENVLIAGQRRAVKKIMAFKRSWLSFYWTDPMSAYAPRLARIAVGRRQAVEPTYYSPQHSSCCTIL